MWPMFLGTIVDCPFGVFGDCVRYDGPDSATRVKVLNCSRLVQGNSARGAVC